MYIYYVGTYRSEKVQVFFYGQIGYEQIVLGAQAQRVPYGFHVGLDVVALYQRGAGRGTDEPGQHRHGGGLAGAVVTEQYGYLVGSHVHGQFVHHVFAGRETLAERLDLYAGLFGHVLGANLSLEPERRLRVARERGGKNKSDRLQFTKGFAD